jgi:hypothetical protein
VTYAEIVATMRGETTTKDQPTQNTTPPNTGNKKVVPTPLSATSSIPDEFDTEEDIEMEHEDRILERQMDLIATAKARTQPVKRGTIKTPNLVQTANAPILPPPTRIQRTNTTTPTQDQTTPHPNNTGTTTKKGAEIPATRPTVVLDQGGD